MINVNQSSIKVKRFCLNNIRKEMEQALDQVKQQINNIFPKSSDRWLSHYQHTNMKIRFHKDGSVRGGIIRILFALIDFSFIRDLVAECYGVEGGNCYDPVTMFLMELMKLWDEHMYYSKFCEDLRDDIKGKHYR